MQHTTDLQRAALTPRQIAERALAAARAREEARTHPARVDFLAFCQEVLRAKDGSPLPVSPYSHILASTLVHCLETGRHLAHMGPPSLGKSTTVRPFLTWALGNDPTLATVIIAAEEKVASRQVGLCRRMLLEPSFKRVFPEVRPDISRGAAKVKGARQEDAQGWRMKEFYLRNNAQSSDPAMAADAADPKGEARRVDILFADDVMSRRVAASKAERERLTDAFLKTWLDGRLAGNGIAVVTHNCWNSDDLIHHLLADGRFIHLWVGVSEDCRSLFVRLWNAPEDLPLLLDPEAHGATPATPQEGAQAEFHIPLPEGRSTTRYLKGRAITENTWTEDWLRAKQLNAPVTFRQLYRLLTVNPEDLMFPAWDKRQRDERTATQILGLKEIAGRAVASNIDRMRLRFVVGVDLSSLKRQGTVVWLLAITQDATVVPIEQHVGRFDDLQLVDLFDDIWGRGFHFLEACLENNALQDRVSKTVEKVARARSLPWWGRLTALITGQNKSHPEHGLPGINTMIHNAQFVWPEGEARRPDPVGKRWKEFAAVMATLTAMASRDSTPDTLMALWIGIERVLRLGRPGGSEKLETIAQPGRTSYSGF